ncbi:MAG TPA: hypothetical protein PKD46_17105 [Aggregatilineaceae bacterium]|nr:hypothetical protein [Aggregatilineaceae bacterium]
MDDTIRLLINSNIPWSVAATIIAIALRPVLATLASGMVDARKDEARALAERNDNEREQTRVLAEVKEALVDSAAITKSVLNLLTPISALPGEIKDIGKRMTERADARDELVRSQGQSHAQRLESLQQLIAGLPQAYLAKSAEHFDPQIAGIQAAVAALRAQIESKPEAMTPDVVKEIRGELAKIARLVTALSEKEAEKETKRGTESGLA